MPLNYPASLKESFGHIGNIVEAFLERFWILFAMLLWIPGEKIKKFIAPFSVTRVIDLNEFYELKMARQGEAIEQFYNCFCKTDYLHMNITVPHLGYIPASNINLTVNFNNKSNVDLIRFVNSKSLGIKKKIKFPEKVCKSKMKFRQKSFPETAE